MKQEEASPGGHDSMRLDLFLKRTRLVKRRAVIKKMCETGLIRVNGRAVAKPARSIKEGDTIELPAGRVVRVVEIPSERSSRAPGRSYEIVPSGAEGVGHAGTD